MKRKKREKNLVGSIGTFFKWLIKNLLASLKENYIAIIIIVIAMVASSICQNLGLDGWYIKVLGFITGQSASSTDGALQKTGALFAKMFLITSILNFAVPFIKKLFKKKDPNQPKKPKAKGVLKGLIDKILCAGAEQIGFIICGFGAAVALYEFLTMGGGTENSFVIILTIMSLISVLLSSSNSIMVAVSKLFKLTPINNAPVFSVTAGLSLGLTFGFIFDALVDTLTNMYFVALAIFAVGLVIILLIKILRKAKRVKVLLENFCILFLILSLVFSQTFLLPAYALFYDVDAQDKGAVVAEYLNETNRPTEITLGQCAYLESEVILVADADAIEVKKVVNQDTKWSVFGLPIMYLTNNFSLFLQLNSDTSEELITGTYSASAKQTFFGTQSGVSNWTGTCSGKVVPIHKAQQNTRNSGELYTFAVVLTFEIDDDVEDNANVGDTDEYFRNNFLGNSSDNTQSILLRDVVVNDDVGCDFIREALYPTPILPEVDNVNAIGNMISVGNTLANQQYALTDEQGNLMTRWQEGSGGSIFFYELEYGTTYTVVTRAENYDDSWGDSNIIHTLSTDPAPFVPTDISVEQVIALGNTISVTDTLSTQQYCVCDKDGVIVRKWTYGNDSTITFDGLEFGTYYVVKTQIQNWDGSWIVSNFTVEVQTDPAPFVPTPLENDDLRAELNSIYIKGTLATQEYAAFDASGTLVSVWVTGTGNSNELIFTGLEYDTDYYIKSRILNWDGTWIETTALVKRTPIRQPLVPVDLAADDVKINENSVTLNNTVVNQQYALGDINGVLGEWVDGNGLSVTFANLKFGTSYTVKTRIKNWDGLWSEAIGTNIAEIMKEVSMTTGEAVATSVAEGVLTTLGATIIVAGISSAAGTAAAAASSAAVVSTATAVSSSVVAGVGSGSGGASIMELFQLFMGGGGKQAVKGLTTSITRAMGKRKKLVKAQLDAARKISKSIDDDFRSEVFQKAHNTLRLKIYEFVRYFPVGAHLSSVGKHMLGGNTLSAVKADLSVQNAVGKKQLNNTQKIAINNNGITFSYTDAEQFLAAGEMFNAMKFAADTPIVVNDCFSIDKTEEVK